MRRKGAHVLLFLFRALRGAWVPNALLRFLAQAFFCRISGAKQLAVPQEHSLLLEDIGDNLFAVFFG